jgi:peptidoglycan L-alanyl-D-glutamate endopeptidase CwlK
MERTMFLFSMLLLFLLACGGAWLLLFPLARSALVQTLMQSVALSAALSAGQWRRRVAWRWRAVSRAGMGTAARAGALRAGIWLRRRAPLIVSALVLLTVPALLAWLVSEPGMVGGFSTGERDINAQVSDLLRGEALAIPAPLPPRTFATLEVNQLRPLLDSANRNWLLLDNAYAQRLLLVFRIMKERHGYDMAILEGYRSPERQNLLAASGPAVTNAGAFQSYHQFGLAADCAFLRNGKLVMSEKDPWAMQGYRLYGVVAESAGLTWGGRWTMMDFGHTELRVPGTLRK